jgi:hypothetical protein
MNLAGTFAPNDELIDMSVRAADLNERIVERTKARAGLRPDIVVDDLSLILEQVSSIRLGDGPRTRELRERYLTLFLDGVRADATDTLPGPPPKPEELASRWFPRRIPGKRAPGRPANPSRRQVKR